VCLADLARRAAGDGRGPKVVVALRGVDEPSAVTRERDGRPRRRRQDSTDAAAGGHAVGEADLDVDRVWADLLIDGGREQHALAVGRDGPDPDERSEDRV
jgi:hypothetical protein